MSEKQIVPDLAGQAKLAAAFFGTFATPGIGPVLKAQADLLQEAETTVTGWLRRCHEAVVDTQQTVAQLRSSNGPFEALKLQQEWLARAFVRMAADTAAYQSSTRQLTDQSKTWFPQAKAFADSIATAAAASTELAAPGAHSDASQAAAITRAAGKPLREADMSA